MEDKINTKDALGVEIILGKRYGYVQNSSGVTTTVVGIAEKFTKLGVTLKVESAMRAVYSYEPEKCDYEKDKVTVKCFNLFPVLKKHA